IADAHQVVGCSREGKHPAHQLKPAMPELPHTTYRLHPAEDLFHALALLLADPIALMSCGSAVNCAVFLLRYVRRGVERTGIRHEAFGVIAFIRSDCHPTV